MRPITRRHVIRLLGVASLAPLTGGSRALAQTCAATLEQTEGPYFVDKLLERSDIRVDPSDGSVQAGVPLRLQIDVTRADDACAAAAGVQVDMWHANAAGLYSDESANGTVGQRFLRGYQTTDGDGRVEFVTIYPGWYRGRTVHIHVKVRAFDSDGSTLAEHTSQLYFDDDVTAAVTSVAPYASRGTPDTSNDDDGIYDSSLLVTAVEDDSGGWVASAAIGVEGFPDTGGSSDDDDDPTSCTDASSCIALVIAALPDPTSGDRATRKVARRLAHLASRAQRALVRAETTASTAKATRLRDRATRLLERLLTVATAADTDGTLGGSLSPLEDAVDETLALLAD